MRQDNIDQYASVMIRTHHSLSYSWVVFYMGQEVLFENNSLTVLQLIMSKADVEARSTWPGSSFTGTKSTKHQVLSGGERVPLPGLCNAGGC